MYEGIKGCTYTRWAVANQLIFKKNTISQLLMDFYSMIRELTSYYILLQIPIHFSKTGSALAAKEPF